MNYELRQYSFGETIGKGFNLYFNNFISIVLVSILCQIPVAILMAGMSSDLSQGTIGASYFINFGLFFFTSIIVSAFLSAYIIHVVSKRFLETNPTNQDTISRSILPYVFPIIGLSIVVGLVTMLGAIFLIIPGIIIALGYSLATEVMVIEQQKIGESMKRSWSLTKGKKGHIFLICLVSGIITVCIDQPLTWMLGLLKMDPQLTIYLTYLVSAITAPFSACILVVVYFNIRIEKEGFNIEHLAQQFTLADQPGPSVEN
ncbi:MAG TPA: hypothetical protein VHY08_20615 [Bacillota bacterium]|nr:hypothetical protein [Bacillota bacterium]